MRVALIVGMTTKTYFASFNTPYDARAALYDLSQAGFDHNDIGIIAFGDENDPEFKSLYDMQDDQAPEGAVVGATTGAAA